MTGAADDTPENDQSMDDILASIRRIMLDEQARLQDGSGHLAYAADRSPATNASVDPVLILDSSMVVEGEPDDAFTIPRVGEAATILPSGRIDMPPAPAEVEQTPDAKRVFVTAPAPAGPAPVSLDHSPQPVVMSAQAIEALMAPAAAAAAAASVDALIKQLSEERLAVLRSSSPAASPGQPTLEDVVRSELRPFLKAWLDEHMPPMVERLVRAEITRLIGRSGS